MSRFTNTLAADLAGEAEKYVRAKYLNAQPDLAKRLTTATFVCDSADHAHVVWIETDHVCIIPSGALNGSSNIAHKEKSAHAEHENGVWWWIFCSFTLLPITQNPCMQIGTEVW